MSEAEVVRGEGVASPTVLVVEDDFLIRAAVVAELRSAGHIVLEAGDTEEALELLAKHPAIELLLTDIAMPGRRDGNYLIRVAGGNYPRLIVVAATANSPYGALDGVLRKPYAPPEAVALVSKLIGE